MMYYKETFRATIVLNTIGRTVFSFYSTAQLKGLKYQWLKVAISEFQRSPGGVEETYGLGLACHLIPTWR